MTARAFVGLLALNACYLGAGVGMLAAFRPVLDRRDALRMLPLAYVVGVAGAGLVLVQLTILGLGPSPAVVAMLAGALLLAGGAAGARRGHLVNLRVVGQLPREPLHALGVAVAAVALVVLAALLRYAWIKPLSAWDAWAVWTPKAMAIHYGDGLTLELFEGLQARTYPLFVPVLQAASFGWMGEVATSALHVQYVILAVGFLLTLTSLLRPIVPLVLIWPFLLLLLVVPGSGDQLLRPEADFPLHYLFVLAALTIALWIVRREPWLLVVATVLLAAGATTKREGILYIAALGLAGLIVTARDARERWPGLIASCVVAGAAAVPWHVWLRTHAVEAESSPTIVGGGGVVGDIADEPNRIWPAIEHVTTKLFSYDLWLVAPTLGGFVVAAGAVLLRDRRIPLFVFIASLIAATGFTWRILWGSETAGAFEEGALPTTRNVAALVFLWCATAPLLLTALFERGRNDVVDSSFRAASRVRLPSSSAILPALVFVVMGIGRGDFAWAKCERPPDGEGPVHVVFASNTSVTEAESIRDHVLALGFTGTTIGRDACGRPRVLLEAIESERIGRALIAEARPAGLNPRLVEP
jgi:hypothetical protein